MLECTLCLGGQFSEFEENGGGTKCHPCPVRAHPLASRLTHVTRLVDFRRPLATPNARIVQWCAFCTTLLILKQGRSAPSVGHALCVPCTVGFQANQVGMAT